MVFFGFFYYQKIMNNLINVMAYPLIASNGNFRVYLIYSLLHIIYNKHYFHYILYTDFHFRLIPPQEIYYFIFYQKINVIIINNLIIRFLSILSLNPYTYIIMNTLIFIFCIIFYLIIIIKCFF